MPAWSCHRTGHRQRRRRQSQWQVKWQDAEADADTAQLCTMQPGQCKSTTAEAQDTNPGRHLLALLKSAPPAPSSTSVHSQTLSASSKKILEALSTRTVDAAMSARTVDAIETQSAASTDATDTPVDASAAQAEANDATVAEASWEDGAWWKWCSSWSSPEGDELLDGDEACLGPDGDLYEIFYPSKWTSYEEIRASAGILACAANPHCQLKPHDEEPGSHACGCGIARQSSAETSMVDILSWMHEVTASRHPARMQLFAAVRSAAQSALGENFGRFALVGSTALGIETPASDLDVVVFTKAGNAGAQQRPSAAVVLRKIAAALAERDSALQLPSHHIEIIDSARVPVLVVRTADRELSLDLSIDQPLPEWHVLWFQSQQPEPPPNPAPLQRVPTPHAADRVSRVCSGLEAECLRCIKWWLRRRGMPTMKEGGYPSLVWTLMALHALRCSVLVDDGGISGSSDVDTDVDCTDSSDGPVARRDDDQDFARKLLGMLAVFFDRFSERRNMSGTMFFAAGKHAEFRPQPPPDTEDDAVPSRFDSWAPFLGAELSVLDPTTTTDMGTEPQGTELAPRISPATNLLHTYEFRRARRLLAVALSSMGPADTAKIPGFDGSDPSGREALRQLFSKPAADVSTLPTVVPAETTGVVLLSGGQLFLGILTRVYPKAGWTAPFLHRRDAVSTFSVKLCTLDVSTGAVHPVGTGSEDGSDESEFHPCHFVCLATLVTSATTDSAEATSTLWLDTDDLERWIQMLEILEEAWDHDHPAARGPGHTRQGKRGRRASGRRRGAAGAQWQ
eukprot:gnl/TRDRNA2_/TRDRNA2_181966_c0_seq1.p1 gnl/TRDRNA2_/TRDRNA2_181966_c0~~gnl/TRDRNA2_/TRDRNA2_181966_c0_seq1.p1  ORF type:complete len:823 (+),score=129.86 gnl/TRDRNA2_/TRDRNA2_181966_c0_seq1:86-2470(+)